MPETLLYGAREMSSAPVGYTSLMQYVDALRKRTAEQFIHLEPGDATRYQLLVLAAEHSPDYARSAGLLEGWWLVQRWHGADLVAGGWVHADHEYENHQILRAMSRSNDWTFQLLRWWLEEFFHAVDSYRRL